jgi:iron complex transport system substrate-binding protein
MRIVSLTPSATEIVCELGIGDQLVGVSHECDYPAFVTGLPKVTRSLIPHEASSNEIDALVRERVRSRQALYSLDIVLLERLKPELIITQSLCDVCAVAEDDVAVAMRLLPVQPQVVNLTPTRFTDMYDHLRLVGDAASVPDAAEVAIKAMKDRVSQITDRSVHIAHRPRVVLLEWIDPPFCSGHWSPELVRLAGGTEGIGRAGEPSRSIVWDEVVNYDPEVLVVACCGFDLTRTFHELTILKQFPRYDEMTCVRDRRVVVTNGNAYFNRPGPRLVDSLEILAHVFHPELHPLPNSLESNVFIGV